MRAVIYDRTCPRLGVVWATGARMYRALGWIDELHGAHDWDDAIAWAARHELDELQYWGHGKWGSIACGRDRIDTANVARLAPLRVRLLWLRTCESFGARAGHLFAGRLADQLGARVAGHTFIIGFRQSGLHALAPGATPAWPADEGLAAGTPDAPVRARWSSWRAPHTLHALQPRLPAWA
jgi:hypothetical protein